MYIAHAATARNMRGGGRGKIRFMFRKYVLNLFFFFLFHFALLQSISVILYNFVVGRSISFLCVMLQFQSFYLHTFIIFVCFWFIRRVSFRTFLHNGQFRKEGVLLQMHNATSNSNHDLLRCLIVFSFTRIMRTSECSVDEYAPKNQLIVCPKERKKQQK